MNEPPISGTEKPYTTIASWYDILDYYWEKRRYAKARCGVWKLAKGPRILDAGAGTGRNIPYYPPGDFVDAIDLSPAMLTKAKKRAELRSAHTKKNTLKTTPKENQKKSEPRGNPAAIQFHQMDICNLGFSSNTFDSIVSTFVLCVLSPEKEEEAIRELWRVLKPGKRLIVLDYTYSLNTFRRAIQKLFSPLIRALYGTRLDSPTRELIEQRFTIEAVRFLHADTLRLIVACKRIK